MNPFRRSKDRPSPDTILSPEGVPLTLPVAGIGVRLAAQITDVLIMILTSACLLFLVEQSDLAQPQTLGAISALLFFLTRVPYHAATELMWNGQTVGKRLLKIKVVSHDGGSLTTQSIVLRNLMKEAEVFLPATLLVSLDETRLLPSVIALAWVAMGFLIPLLNPHRQRLGDLLAGTHVIHLPEPVLLKDLAREEPLLRAVGRAPIFLNHQLDHYGAFELHTLEGLLRVDDGLMLPAARAAHRRSLAAIIEKIRRKTGYAEPVAAEDHAAFLQAFYTAQRAHLEQRQLFGDRRANKHHADTDPSA